MISSGVIMEPPPMPVSPMRMPTPSPKAMISGSTSTLSVDAALGLVLARPASLAPRSGLRARRAPDRGVTAVVERVVGHLVLHHVAPHLLLRPIRQWIELPDAVRLVPRHLARRAAGRG